MSKAWENVTKQKIFWYVVAGIGIVIAFYILIKLIQKYKPKSDITDGIEVNTSNLTFNDAQYRMFADQIFNAMEGAGTGEDAIFAVVFQLKTLDDWNMLVKAYGTRKLTSFWVTTHDGTLPSALHSELGKSDITKINNHLATFGASI